MSSVTKKDPTENTPDIAVFQLTDRQENILYNREVEDASRTEIAESYEKIDGADGKISEIGVASHLHIARKKRELALATYVYADENGLIDHLSTEHPPVEDLDIPEYVTVPSDVSAEDTGFFNRQQTIVDAVVRHEGDNKKITREIMSPSSVTTLYQDAKKVVMSDFDGEYDETVIKAIKTSAAKVLGRDINDEPLVAITNEAIELIDSSESNAQQVRDRIDSKSNVWSVETLKHSTATDLLCMQASVLSNYQTAYSTTRQYLYNRIPNKLNDAKTVIEKPNSIDKEELDILITE